jgi:hypothetical protein
MDMEGVNQYVDPKSVVYGAVGGLLVGAVLGGVLMARQGHKHAKELEQEIDDLTTHFLVEMDKERQATRDLADDIEERIARGVANYLAREYSPSDASDDEVMPGVRGPIGNSGSVDYKNAFNEDGSEKHLAQIGAEFVAAHIDETLEYLGQPVESADEDESDDAGGILPGDVPVDMGVVRNVFSAVQPPISLGPQLKNPFAVLASTSPHMITEEEYGEIPGWGTATVKWWSEDGVLTDDQDNPANDWIQLVGENIADQFGLNPENPDVVLIRCPRLELDYEVALMRGSYHKDILGYDPAEQAHRQPPKIIVRNRP